MKDLFSSINLKRVISPYVATDNTAAVGQIIDRAGYDSLVYAIATGTLADADATFTVLLEDGDNSGLSDAATVVSANLNGTAALASFLFSDDDKCFKLGYVGGKRYTRMTITPGANTGNAAFGVVAILGNPVNAPTANPPA